MRYHALIPAAGNGSRFRGDSPKQYWMLEGKPVLVHSLERLAAAFTLQQAYVAIAPGDRWYDQTIGARPGVTALRCGGATRGETVRNALAALNDVAADDWILIHDAVRPCVDLASLSRLREELAGDAVGGLLALPVVGTLKRADTDGRSSATEPREGLWSAQTPQMFRFGVLERALAATDAVRCTDEAQAVEALGMAPRLVPGNPSNLKITYPDDLTLAAAIMAVQNRAPNIAIAAPPILRDRAA
jgi:2-C-methyl-D-erythritol 4-phosphate cytidylyltransferase